MNTIQNGNCQYHNPNYDVFGLKRIEDVIENSGPVAGIYSGLKHPEQIAKLDKTYGNAYDPQYNLVKII